MTEKEQARMKKLEADNKRLNLQNQAVRAINRDLSRRNRTLEMALKEALDNGTACVYNERKRPQGGHLRVDAPRLILAIEEAGYTQTELADRAGISRATLSGTLARQTASARTVLKLAKALTLEPGEIMKED